MSTEADTSTRFIVPKLAQAGWDCEPHSFIEQHTFTDGRIVVRGRRATRLPKKRADYLLRYRRDFMIAVVEAKKELRTAADGLQQAKDYAAILGLKFAYATNGHEIIEFDFIAGHERLIDAFPTPDELWARLKGTLTISTPQAEDQLLAPFNHASGKSPRYYQEIAINRTVAAIIGGKRRVLLTMATGTGKTVVAFQICWKLWNSGWNLIGEYRKPKILYLADRKFLIDDPKDKTFAPFGDARDKITSRNTKMSRELYFATYQTLAEDENRPGLYKEYAPDFFDLVIVDECHRGSARDDSNWRDILDYFAPAAQLGMTATPLRDDNRDTYAYFGDPIYQYSLKQGIDDGFLAPYRVHRVITTWDAAGWRPDVGERDRYGQEIPDDEYHTKDFERTVALQARTEAIAKHLSDFMRKNDRFAKTIVFCVDQEHADTVRRTLNNLNADLVQQHPDYVCRVTADEGDIGRGHLDTFTDLETITPVILTTSQLLTTGVDAPTCQNVVLARVVGSMTEFKQIIGRGTRVREDYGKLYFNIIDYTGSATERFADPDFDGFPEIDVTEEVNEEGRVIGTSDLDEQKTNETPDGYEVEPNDPNCGLLAGEDGGEPRRRKFYVDGGQVEIAAHLVLEFDADGRKLRTVSLTDYTAEKVRMLYPSMADLHRQWIDPEQRQIIIERLNERGIDFSELAELLNQPDADPFDLLCHLAFNAPLRTRRERAERLRRDQHDFFDQFGPHARQILDELLDKYAVYGIDQFVLPDALQIPPLSDHGNITEISQIFGDARRLRAAITQLQTLLYAA